MALPHGLTPALVTSLIGSMTAIVAASSSFFTRKRFRRNGRRAVEQELARRGETPTLIAEMPISALSGRTGLGAAAFLFHVEARTTDGAPRVYEWAYEPALVARQRRALKQFAKSVWIPLA